MIDVRAKGAEGERQVVRALNECLQRVLTRQGWPEEVVKACSKAIQRNQNQSAVGGCDLSNVFGLAIEVKRQQALSINTWWRQCIVSAMKNRELPVLIYRQNNQPWSVVMYLQNPLPILKDPEIVGVEQYASSTVRAELGWDDFLKWFEEWVFRKLLNGDLPRV